MVSNGIISIEGAKVSITINLAVAWIAFEHSSEAVNVTVNLFVVSLSQLTKGMPPPV